MAVPRAQLRMNAEELDRFLTEQRTLRLATLAEDGVPHVVPLWFVWRDGAIWLNSLARSRRHAHLRAGRPVGLVVDDGQHYGELRGVRMSGRPEVVADGDPGALAAARAFAAKYFGTSDMPNQRAYEIVRIHPDDVTSWDFRKIPAGRDRKVDLDRE